ncbi:3-deoxy-7-phosphoheptulonate synthase [Dietzia sp.]|uniref:3-deoxy-7-phosphoheptulonate synthase n=1 Tax=Dietzia sp. TaxID=1871616 RepID=UPI002FDB886E
MSQTASQSNGAGNGAAGADPTDDRRVVAFHPLPTPKKVRGEYPLSDMDIEVVENGRRGAADILAGRDDRLLVVVGPCSVHDPEAALDYARRLAALEPGLADQLLIVMRVYFEKPRTTVGWKGLINDPGMDGSFDIARGLRTARKLLTDVLDLGLPVGCEFLEPNSPQYIADAVSWGAIGARTTESQVHRQLASGVSMPIGFKNATDGRVGVAIDGCQSASAPHQFFGMDGEGRTSVVETTGNADCHVILRGGTAGPNADAESVAAACAEIGARGMNPGVMVDASHANSGKDHVRQAELLGELADRIAEGETGVNGVMIESFLVGGAQSTEATPLTYGQSVTDKCIDWETTEASLRRLHEAVARRRELIAAR